MDFQRFGVGLLLVLMLAAVSVRAQGAPASPSPAPAPGKDAAGKTAEAPSDQRYMMGPQQADQVLADQFPDQAQWLTAGQDRFVGLSLPETTGNPQGAVLIIADIGLSADSGLAGGLRRKLPDYGWFTLSIGLPPSPLPTLPARSLPAKVSGAANGKVAADGSKDKTQDKAADTAKSAKEGGITIDVAQAGGDQAMPGSAKDFMTLAKARLAAGLSYLQGAGYGNIALIGVGRGADVIAHYAADNSKTLPRAGMAMVWVRADMTGDAAKNLGKALGDGFAMPVLDIVNSDRSLTFADARQGAARRANFANYQQQWLPLDDSSGLGATDNVVSRVSSWLELNLKGMKAKAYPAKGSGG